MKALTRMRKLAATLALLSMTLTFSAPIAQAGLTNRPIDRTEAPPELEPEQIGEPDWGNGGMPREAMQAIFIEALISRLPILRPWFSVRRSLQRTDRTSSIRQGWR